MALPRGSAHPRLIQAMAGHCVLERNGQEAPSSSAVRKRGWTVWTRDCTSRETMPRAVSCRRPPVSHAKTVRSPYGLGVANSGYVRSLSCTARAKLAPSTSAARVQGVPSRCRGDTMVASPHMGRPNPHNPHATNALHASRQILGNKSPTLF